MISIVCAYNNEKVFTEMLLKSLNEQTVEFELIQIDNTLGKFRSAAEAWNTGGKQANGKYIMFVHQDIDLSSNSWLENAEKYLDSINQLGIAGVAGMSDIGNSNKMRGRNIIEYGEPKILWQWGNEIQDPEIVQTLDECLVIIPKSVFNILQFDENTCDGWHFYAADYCLSIKRYGYEVFVIPMSLYHKSPGARSKNYYPILNKLLTKHKKYYDHIYTTYGDWYTSRPVIIQRMWLIMKSILQI